MATYRQTTVNLGRQLAIYGVTARSHLSRTGQIRRIIVRWPRLRHCSPSLPTENQLLGKLTRAFLYEQPGEDRQTSFGFPQSCAAEGQIYHETPPDRQIAQTDAPDLPVRQKD
jgi:hypothetical protein